MSLPATDDRLLGNQTPITPIDQKVDTLRRQVALQREALILLLKLVLQIQRHRTRSVSDPQGHLRAAEAERALQGILDRI